MRYEITLNGKVYEVEVENQRAVMAASAPRPGQPRLVRAAQRGQSQPGERRPAPARQVAPARQPSPAIATPSADLGEALPAPMPGLIQDVRVRPGDQVKAGAALVILEAMKMENVISAPYNATVSEVAVTQGQTVTAGQTLVWLRHQS